MNVFRIYILGALIILSISDMISQEKEHEAHLISVEELARHVEDSPELLLLDVRTKEEYEEGHLPGARNMDFLSEDFLLQVEQLPKDQAIYIYCRSGNRSAKAADLMRKAGFRQLYDLEGGYLKWEEEKLKKQP